MHKLTKLLEISFTTKPKISLELFGISKRTSNTLITGFNDVICGYSLSISDCGKNFLSVKNTGILWYNQVQLFRQLENQHSFWNRSTFLNKHLILSRSSNEPLSGNSVKFLTAGQLVHLRPCPAAGHNYSHSKSRYLVNT